MRTVKYQMDSASDMTLRISNKEDSRIIFFAFITVIFFVGGFIFVFITGFSLFRFFLFFVILIVLIIGGIGLPVKKKYQNQRKSVSVKSGSDATHKKSTKYVMVCASCGQKVSSKDTFCSECGIIIN